MTVRNDVQQLGRVRADVVVAPGTKIAGVRTKLVALAQAVLGVPVNKLATTLHNVLTTMAEDLSGLISSLEIKTADLDEQVGAALVGPGSSTDRSVPVFDGTTGKLLADPALITIPTGGTIQIADLVNITKDSDSPTILLVDNGNSGNFSAAQLSLASDGGTAVIARRGTAYIGGTDRLHIDDPDRIQFAIGSDVAHLDSSGFDLTGDAALDGAVTVNDSGADKDFRVESSGRTAMLFVDGGSNAVGINTSAPASERLHVKGDTQAWVRIEASTNTAGIEFKSTTISHQAFQLDTGQNMVFRNTTGSHSGSLYFDYKSNTNFRHGASTTVMQLSGADRAIFNRFINFGDTELTISGGAVTAVSSYHSIDTESDAATDDLDTINGGSDGDLLILRAANSARTVVVKDGSFIQLAGGADCTLDHINDTLTLIKRSATWVELSRSDNS